MKYIILLLLLFSNPVIAKNDYLNLWEEEKLARDIYSMMSRKYDVKIFYNIKSAEERHLMNVESLFKEYNIPIPVYRNQIGVFNIQKYKDLYASLISKGNLSLRDALDVGIMIEESDIKDLEEMIKNAESENENNILHSLRSGSLNHLDAFQRQ